MPAANYTDMNCRGPMDHVRCTYSTDAYDARM